MKIKGLYLGPYWEMRIFSKGAVPPLLGILFKGRRIRKISFMEHKLAEPRVGRKAPFKYLASFLPSL